MIILAVLVIALWVGYGVLSAANKKAEEDRLAEELAKDEVLMIADNDYLTMTELSYTKKGEETLKFYGSNGVFIYSEDENFPLDSTKVAYMSSAIARIGVECEVDGGDPADFGFDDPEYVIKVKYADGRVNEYKIGDLNTFTGTYYFMADEKVYMVASGLLTYFDYTLYELMVLDTVPQAMSDINYVTGILVKADGKENTVEDSDGKGELVKKLLALSLDDWRDYYADGEEKTSYGIDGEDLVKVTYKEAVPQTDANGNSTTNYLETTFTLFVGDSDGEDGIYISVGDSDIVYSVPVDELNEIVAFTDYTPSEKEQTEN